MKLFGKELKFNDNDIYHEGNKPVASDIVLENGENLEDKFKNLKTTTTWNDIESKPSTFPPSEHTHAWDNIQNKPSAFPPSEHTHDGMGQVFYSETEPSEAKEGDIWYKINASDAKTQTFTYKSSAQTYIVPTTGQYTITCYGAIGGARSTSTTYSGKGGKVSGKINLTKGETLYIYTGQSGNVTSSEAYSSSYTFNGGGKGGYSTRQYGGGATDVRLVGGNWDDTASLNSRIIVAGGGGSCGGTSKTGGNSDTAATSGYGTGGQAGTQTDGGTGHSSYTSTKGLFGKGGAGYYANSGYGGGGGGGWYGGAGTYPDSSGDDDKGGGGGSNYILTSTSTKPSGYTPTSKHYFTETSITTTNSEVNGKVEIVSPSYQEIKETYVYYNGQWLAAGGSIDLASESYPSLNTTDKTIVGGINELFQSVSSGKSSIAQAITSKGITASANESFSSLSDKIKQMYGAGSVLTEGTHFDLVRGLTIETNFSYASQNSLTGDIVASSGKYVYTKFIGSHNGSYATHVLLYEWNNNKYTYISSSSSFTADEISKMKHRVAGTYYLGPTDSSETTFRIYDFSSGRAVSNITGISNPSMLYNGEKTYFVYSILTGPEPPTSPDMPPTPPSFTIYINTISGDIYTKVGEVNVPVSTGETTAYTIDKNYLYFNLYEASYLYYGKIALSDFTIKEFPFHTSISYISYLEKMQIVNDHLIIINADGITIAPINNTSNKTSLDIYNSGTINMIRDNGITYDSNNIYIINNDNQAIIAYDKSKRVFNSTNITIPSGFTNMVAVENNTKYAHGAIVEGVKNPLEIKLK